MPKKAQSESSQQQQVYLVVGGGGFLGRAIVEMLLARGETQVRVFDLRKTFEDIRIQFFLGDIRKEADLLPALEGVTCVFNTVSPPHGGKYEVYYGVNVEGTRTLLKASAKKGVKAFVHTSSASVVFEGKDLRNADETLPYCKKHLDPYNYTKELAERDVLASNGKDGMLTVAIRPSGIFGPRDAQFWPTLIQMAKEGKSKFRLGSGNVADFTYVDNVAHAHILAADRITSNPGIAGEAFFITNDEQTSTNEMARYCYAGLGYKEPSVTIPVFVVWYLAILIDIIVWLLSPFVKLHPNLTFFRVANGVCDRNFNISKAKKNLGYKPVVSLKDGMKKTLEYFKAEEEKKSKSK